MEARDIMTKGVIAVAPDMLINEAADLLMRYRIHGVGQLPEKAARQALWSAPGPAL